MEKFNISGINLLKEEYYETLDDGFGSEKAQPFLDGWKKEIENQIPLASTIDKLRGLKSLVHDSFYDLKEKIQSKIEKLEKPSCKNVGDHIGI